MNLQTFAIIAIAAIGVFLGFIEYQRRDAAEKAVQAQRQRAFEATEKEIGKISDTAERARAMRNHCGTNGLRYDFGTGKCIK